MKRSIDIGRRRTVQAVGGSLLASALWPITTRAETIQTVRVILAPPAGSAVDALARRVAKELKPAYCNNAFVDNRPGAGGIIAVSAVKQATPDGTTLLVTPSPPMAIYPLTYKTLPYDPETDLAPVSLASTFDIAIAVGPLVPTQVATLKDYFAWCSANPDKANCGLPGLGGLPHFVVAMTAKRAGVGVQSVAYRGPSPAVVDMISGQIGATCTPLGDVAHMASSGKCRILGTTGDKRSRFAPNVPTFAEQGYGEYASKDWIGIYLPARTPAAVVQKLNETMRTMLADKSVIAALEDQAMDSEWSTPQALVARVETDRAKWAPVVKALNFTADA